MTKLEFGLLVAGLTMGFVVGWVACHLYVFFSTRKWLAAHKATHEQRLREMHDRHEREDLLVQHGPRHGHGLQFIPSRPPYRWPASFKEPHP